MDQKKKKKKGGQEPQAPQSLSPSSLSLPLPIWQLLATVSEPEAFASTPEAFASFVIPPALPLLASAALLESDSVRTLSS